MNLDAAQQAIPAERAHLGLIGYPDDGRARPLNQRVGRLAIASIANPGEITSMTDDDLQRPYGPPRPAAQSEDVETAAAKRLDEVFAKTAKASGIGNPAEYVPVGLLARALRVVTLLTATLAGGTLLYGFINFLDAPIRPTATGYVGKQGQPHTAQDYENFLAWERALFIAFPATFIAGVAHQAAISRERSKRKQ